MSFKIITISREFGSGGRFIGEQIAQKCGIEFYDKKIIEHVAKELGISEQIVANQGEYAPAGSIFSYAFVGRDITGVSLSDQIFNIQQKLIKDIANGKDEKKTKNVTANDFVYREYEEKLKTVFGSKVIIHNKENNKGKIEINYGSREEFERIVELIEKGR